MAKVIVLDVLVYIIYTDVPFLFGKKTFEQGGYILNSRNGILETLKNGSKKELKIATTDSIHY